MSRQLVDRIYRELSSLVIVDPHTHIDPHAPASTNLADLLGYHYYTELAHSAGMPKASIEAAGLDPQEKVRRLVENLSPLENTIQYRWLIEIAQQFFGFQGDWLTPHNFQDLYDAAEKKAASPTWADDVLKQSKLSAVFLTNDFDDPLEGFDTKKYVPCLRTDDLVFHLAKPSVRERLAKASGVDVKDAQSLQDALAALFKHFYAKGCKACAISLPPDFSPAPVTLKRADTAVADLYAKGEEASEAQRQAAARFVFWSLAELCDQHDLPFDLMIGVNRSVYREGVHQGRDLYDSRVSLIQYAELFNAFPGVTFPVSVLASVTNQELASYSWIFPNVVANGHWWYSNTPSVIERDLSARIEAVPRTKLVGYYSDMYKLEFALPKFAMYRRVLAKVLAEKYVLDLGWSEAHAIELGTRILKRNTEEIFKVGAHEPKETPASKPPLNALASAGSSAAVLGTVGALGESELEAIADLETQHDEIESMDLSDEVIEEADLEVAALAEEESVGDELYSGVPIDPLGDSLPLDDADLSPAQPLPPVHELDPEELVLEAEIEEKIEAAEEQAFRAQTLDSQVHADEASDESKPDSEKAAKSDSSIFP
jgi:glucuronate isomerase